MGCAESRPASDPQPLPQKQQKYRQKQQPPQTVSIRNDFIEAEAPQKEDKRVNDDGVLFEEENQTKQIPLKEVESREKTKEAEIQQNGEVQPAEEEVQEQITDMGSLMRAVKKHIVANNHYQQFMNQSYLLQIFDEIQKYYLSKEHQIAIHNLLVNFMKRSHQAEEQEEQLDLIKNYAETWSKTKNHIFEYNKTILWMLSYLVPKREQQDKVFQHCFLDLEWRSSLNEYYKVAAVVRQMLEHDQKSFCYLTNYLVRCCQKMEKEGINLDEIQKRLLQQLQLQESRDKIKNEEKDQAMDKHPNRKVVLPIKQKCYLNLKPETDKQTQIDTFVATKLQEADKAFSKFCIFMQNFNFRLQLLDQTNNSLNLVKQKVVDLAFDKLTVQKYNQLTANPSLEDYIKTQLEEVSKQKKQIYNFIDGQLEFKASCMITGKAVFDSVGQINDLVDELMAQFPKQQLTGVELKNKLKGNKGVRQIVLIVLVDKIRCEIHLMLRDRRSDLIFNRFVSQIRDSKKYSPITALYMLNEQLSQPYFGKMHKIIQDNIKSKKRVTFGLPDTWNTGSSHFKQLIKLLKLKLQPLAESKQRIELLKDKFMEIFALTSEIQVNPLTKIANNICYKSVLKDYKTVEKQSHNFIQQIQTQFPNLLHKAEQPSSLTDTHIQALKLYSFVLKSTAISHMQRERYTKAVQVLHLYVKILNILTQGINLEFVEAKKLIAKCQCKSFEYKRALEALNQALAELNKDPLLILEHAKVNIQIADIYLEQGTDFKALQLLNESIQNIYDAQLNDPKLESLIFKKIGLSFIKSGDQQQALVYLEKAVALTEIYAGKNNIESVNLQMEIASIYEKQKQYEISLQKLQHCYEIIVKSKGQHSIQLVDVFHQQAVIYSSLQQLNQAQKIYLSSLRILQKTKGKGSFEYGQCCEYLGQVYLSLSNHQLSLRYLFKALTAVEKHHGKETIHSAAILQKISKNYNKLMNYKEEEHYLTKLNNIMQKEKANQNYSHMQSFNNIGQKSAQRGNYQVAIKYYKKSLEIVQQLKGTNSQESVQIRKQIGSILKYQEKYKAAQQEYEKCLTVLSKVKGGGSMDRAQLSLQMGHLFYLQQQYDLAQEHYLQAYNLCIRFKVKYWIYGLSCYRLAMLYDKQYKMEAALKMYKDCLPIYKEMHAKEEVEIQEKIGKLRKELFDSATS